MTRGFTILETLVNLFILALVMVVGSSMLSSYRSVMDTSSSLDSQIQGIQSGFQRIRQETQSAFEVILPVSGANASELHLRLRNQAYAIPNSPGLSWTPEVAARTSEVRYLIQNGALTRTDSSTGSTAVLAYGVSGMSVENRAGSLNVVLSFTGARRVSSLSSTIWAPCLSP